jgi:hypothetical protein
MVSFSQVRRQISYDPCDRRCPKATSEQLDYLADLILSCEGRVGFRWDYTQPESFTTRRASLMIESLKQILK